MAPDVSQVEEVRDAPIFFWLCLSEEAFIGSDNTDGVRDERQDPQDEDQIEP